MINAAYHFSLSPGTVLEEYRITSVLGQGSFGVTYLAEDVNLGTRLAIKEYLPGDWAFRDSTQTVRPKSTAASESFERGRDAFLKEARLLAQVVHPNIVKVRRFFRAHGTAYIAMDFIGGRSLADILNEDYRSGSYPSSALKQLLVTVLGGLAALHEQRIIHRDIKPANIVIESSGNPMLVDFGAARNFGSAVAQGMTVIVTPGYAPIEQYSDDGEQGPFTDIYALGALAYRAITGHPPDAPYKRLGPNSSPPAASAGAGKYPQLLLEAIDWALAVQPQDRPQSAEALLARVRVAPDDVPRPLDEPTQILSEATQSLEALRWRGVTNGRAGRAELSLKSGATPERSARAQTSTAEDAVSAAVPKRRGRLAPTLVAALIFAAAIGAGAYYLVPGLPLGSSTADQDAATKARKNEAAAEAARAEAARQAAARAEAERAAAAAAQQKAAKEAAEARQAEAARQAAAQAEADRQAAAKADADRKAAAKAEADRQAAAKAEADKQAAAKAEADRQAAIKAEADRQAAAKAEADRQAAAKEEVDRQAAAKAEADRQATAKAEAERQAAAAAEADRQAAAEAARQKAAREAAARAEEKRAAAATAAAAANKRRPASLDTAAATPSDRARCSSILENAQLKEQISDDDKSFLREHCH